MGKIKQLSHHEAQKIAAGEVVERPANIVKELVENAIDAGATRISLFLEDGGKKLIRIVDNGCGMDTDDALLCFNRHATSKVTSVDQLETIQTFGFRGEALASIAAVSTITLITNTDDTLSGSKIIVNANVIVSHEAIAAPTGTDISIHQLFASIPARKKFLKTTQTEWRTIQLLFDAFCFDYPHIHFTCFSESKQIINAPAFAKASSDTPAAILRYTSYAGTQDERGISTSMAQALKTRAQQLWETKIGQHLLEIPNTITQHGTFEGIITDHQQYRYDRSSIYLFVNKRWVKNQHLTSALIKGYANVIPAGRFPYAVINITIDPTLIDINIHPRKEEVKFLHPRVMEVALQDAVKKALENNVKPSLQLAAPVVTPVRPEFIEGHFKPFDFDTFFKPPTTEPTISNNPGLRQGFDEHVDGQAPYPIELYKAKLNQNEPAITLPAFTLSTNHPNLHASAQAELLMRLEDYVIIGQYKKTYIIIEKETGLFLVDQHAAHERILYELFSTRFTDVATVHLLFPQIITLAPHDIELVTQHLTLLQNNGIMAEQCASNQLIVQSLPVHLKEHALEDIVKTIAGWIGEYQHLDEAAFKKTLNEKLHAQMACKAAVKAGDVLTQEQMKQLLTDLSQTANRFSCPHGRPTGWLISIDEIERKFKRKL